MRQINYFLGIVVILLTCSLMACEGPIGPEGPEGDQGEQGPPGENGNSNVTLYIFDGHDFTLNSLARREIEDVTETEMQESRWNVYLVHSLGWTYHLSGYGVADETMYFTAHRWVDTGSQYVDFWIEAADGPGEEYEEIRIIRTEADNVNDQRTEAADIDYSDYRQVADYYDLSDEDAVRVSSQ